MIAAARNAAERDCSSLNMVTSVDNILAIDSSGAACSAALWCCGTVVGGRYHAMVRGHAEALMPMITETVAGAGMSLRGLDAVAVTVGPGAFTGLRIGLAAARGIGMAAGIPVIGVTTFAAVAESIPENVRRDRGILVVLDTKRGDLFAQFFTGDLAPVGLPVILAPEAAADLSSAEPTVLAGDGVALVRPHLRGDLRLVDIHSEGPINSIDVVQAAVRLVESGQVLPPPVPVYLRAPEVRLALGTILGTVSAVSS